MDLGSYSPIAGLPQPGFTTPTMTLVRDIDPARNARQWYVSAVSGMPGVDSHSAEKPFTITMRQPTVTAVLGVANVSGTGFYVKVGRNKYHVFVRKSGQLNATTGQRGMIYIDSTIDLPAGMAGRDDAAVKAAVSLAFGAVVEIGPDIITSLTSGSWVQ